MTQVADNLRDIRARIAEAAARCGRQAAEIRLIAVSKTQPAHAIFEAIAAGVTDLGENYIQEAAAKFAALGPAPVVRHFIGHLQRNKAGRAAALFDVVQSVDSGDLAVALGRRCEELGRTLTVLLEVNASGEASKFGVEPGRVLDLAEQVTRVSGLRLAGLMGMAPLGADEGAARCSFRRLKQLYDQLPAQHREVLSMGMTGDFELAIAEGSTMVRIGTGIFGARPGSSERDRDLRS